MFAASVCEPKGVCCRVVHQYKNNGYNIVLDVHSGAVHVVDDLVYDVISLLEQQIGETDAQPDKESILSELSSKYTAADIEEAVGECMELRENGTLFSYIYYFPALR